MGINLPMTQNPGTLVTLTQTQPALYAKATSAQGTAISIANNVPIRVFSPTGPAPIACSENGQILLNLGVTTGEIWAFGAVSFPGGSTTQIVTGNVRLNPGGSSNNGTGQVSGTVVTSAITRQTTTITATFPVLSGTDFSITTGTATINPGAIVNVFVDGGTLTITPGSYGDLVVNGGTVIFQAGDYTFTNVTINPAGTFRSTGTSSLIRIAVRQVLIHRGICDQNTPGTTGFLTQNLRWVVFGTGDSAIGLSSTAGNHFRGTVVVMNGKLIIDDGARTYRGQFFARNIQVNGGPTVELIGFSAWETPT